MDKFRLGIITGMSSLVVATPLLLQVTSAQTSDIQAEPAVPSQACVDAMADIERIHLDQFDVMNAKRKEMIEDRLAALEAAAAISDDAARQEALKSMRESMKDGRGDIAEEMSDEMKAAREVVKTACGDTLKFHVEKFKGNHPFIGKMMDKVPAFMADKLGMTEDELKAAMDEGKKIREIAEENGVDLPEPPRGGRFMMKFESDNAQ